MHTLLTASPTFDFVPALQALQDQMVATLSPAWPTIATIMGAMVAVGIVFRLIQKAVSS